MKSIFFFGILLLATASRLRVPVDEQLAQIDSTSYGKTLLDTLQIQLTSGSSVDAIVELLDELAADMHADQAVDDRLNATRQNECDTEIAEFDRRINTANAEITDAELQLASLRPALATTQEQIETKNREIESLSNDIANFKNAHSGDTTSYADRVAEHEAAIGAIDEAIIELSKLIGSQAGEGIHEKSERIDAETKAGVFAQVRMLTKLAAKADQDAVQKIIDLLDETKVNLQASIDNEQDTNTMAIEDYDELLGSMEHTLNDLRVAEAALQEEELRLAAEIGKQETRLQQNTDELNAATAERNAKIAQCEEWSRKYKDDTQKRREELDVVDQCKDIFVTELGDMSDYLSDRVES